MNAEIIKRGTIPHHRFAEYFGRFVICLSEIGALLSEDRPDVFIEKSQILGARLIVGSHRFEEEFVARVVKTHIFDKKREYISQMINEMYSRRSVNGESVNNIKECSGGLRDVEMMMLIIKAEFGIKEPVNAKLFEDVAVTHAALEDDLRSLARGFEFLKHLRDIYRLTAGATDAVTEPALETPALIMGYAGSKELFGEFKRVSGEVSATIDRLLGKLKVS
jgi:UTP:GlnB (protein PII) uridylyltransferase